MCVMPTRATFLFSSFRTSCLGATTSVRILVQTRCNSSTSVKARFFSVPLAEAFDSPTDRLTRFGLDALGAEELIALILQRGRQGQGGLEIARQIARHFGSISRLEKAGSEELTALSGLSPEQAAALVAAFRLARLAALDLAPLRLVSAADVAAVAIRELRSATRERTIVLVCDAGIISGKSSG